MSSLTAVPPLNRPHLQTTGAAVGVRWLNDPRGNDDVLSPNDLLFFFSSFGTRTKDGWQWEAPAGNVFAYNPDEQVITSTRRDGTVLSETPVCEQSPAELWLLADLVRERETDYANFRAQHDADQIAETITWMGEPQAGHVRDLHDALLADDFSAVYVSFRQHEMTLTQDEMKRLKVLSRDDLIRPSVIATIQERCDHRFLDAYLDDLELLADQLRRDRATPEAERRVREWADVLEPPLSEATLSRAFALVRDGYLDEHVVVGDLVRLHEINECDPSRLPEWLRSFELRLEHGEAARQRGAEAAAERIHQRFDGNETPVSVATLERVCQLVRDGYLDERVLLNDLHGISEALTTPDERQRYDAFTRRIEAAQRQHEHERDRSRSHHH